MYLNHIMLNKMQGALSRRPLGAAPLSARVPIAASVPAHLNDWYCYLVPTYSQKFQSCVGHGWANWLECIVRRYIGREAIPFGMQLDGDQIWRYARNAWWKGDMNGGIYVTQGIQAMLALGWLPSDATQREVPSAFDAWNEALAETPLVQGHRVTDDWISPSKENGCLTAMYGQTEMTGGHCTLGVAAAWQDDQPYRALLNSWGSAWGYHGIGLMTDGMWLETALDDVTYTVDIPGGFKRLENEGKWRDALIKTPLEAKPL